MDTNKKTLVILGASNDQLFMIRTAQDMGLRVLALDMNEWSPGFAVADDSAVISTRDVPAICAYLDEYRKTHAIAGVTTMGSDIPDIVAQVAAHLGARSVSLESARLTVDKYAMKARFKERGIPIPWFKEIASAEELRQVIAQRGLPLIIKPVDRSGSRGVFKLRAGDDADELYARSKEFSFSGRVQVEEYLPGPQISTETVMYQGRAATPGFADRNYEGMERFLPQIMENGGWVPSTLSAADRIAVEALVERASLALDITDGVTKGDVVMTPNGPKMIEMASRLSGGDFCAGLVPLGTGVNYVEAAINLAIGALVDFDAFRQKWNKAVANRYFFPEAGTLVRIEGVEEARAQPWLQKLEFWYKPGDVVPSPLSHAHRFGVFMVVADTRAEAEKRVEWVYRTIKIITE